MHILPLYASILALLFVTLSIRTLRLRGILGIAIGDGGNESMLRAIRVHANFAEYVPLGLLLIYLVEAQGAQALLVHGLALCLLAGRVLHAFGVSQTDENFKFRVTGMAMTFATLIVSSLYLLRTYIHGLWGVVLR